MYLKIGDPFIQYSDQFVLQPTSNLQAITWQNLQATFSGTYTNLEWLEIGIRAKRILNYIVFNQFCLFSFLNLEEFHAIPML